MKVYCCLFYVVHVYYYFRFILKEVNILPRYNPLLDFYSISKISVINLNFLFSLLFH